MIAIRLISLGPYTRASERTLLHEYVFANKCMRSSSKLYDVMCNVMRKSKSGKAHAWISCTRLIFYQFHSFNTKWIVYFVFFTWLQNLQLNLSQRMSLYARERSYKIDIAMKFARKQIVWQKAPEMWANLSIFFSLLLFPFFCLPFSFFIRNELKIYVHSSWATLLGILIHRSHAYFYVYLLWLYSVQFTLGHRMSSTFS